MTDAQIEKASGWVGMVTKNPSAGSGEKQKNVVRDSDYAT